MSLTLGQKLRQAREERGISITEVSEQTRISPHYIESIENDDYKTLPGGIFNKGFVKSYARYVGYDEHEALSDYSQLMSSQNDGAPADEPRFHRPEVLTDEYVSTSRWPTLLFAAVILGLMTAGLLFLVNYVKNRTDQPAANMAAAVTPAANSANANTASPPASTSSAPVMGAIKVEFNPSDDVYLTTVLDGKRSETLVKRDNPLTLEPKDSLVIGYHRSRADAAKLSINGKQIELPREPLTPKSSRIEFSINSQTLPEIWQNGKVGAVQPIVEQPTATRTVAPRPKPVTTPSPRASGTPAAAKPTTSPKAAPLLSPR